MTSLFQ